MPSTNTVFIFLFLPVFLIIYHAVLAIENRFKFNFSLAKYGLILLNLYIFSVGDTRTLKFILVYALLIYSGGVLVKCLKQELLSNIVLAISILFVLGILILQVGFSAETVASFKMLPLLARLKAVRFLGVSFISFTAISYLVDVSKGWQVRSFADFFVYLLFFPKVFSGPIVLWRDFELAQGIRPVQDIDLFVSGINRFVIGLAKKIIIADAYGELFRHVNNNIDTGTAYLIMVYFAVQMYVDFSAYSDMAIGLGRMCGYQIKENFCLPYQASSIADFWRRWHISLGAWFRNYVYFPLGGSRKGIKRTILNVAVVFFLTGIWHGVGFGYLMWGMMHGLGVILDRFAFMQRIPKVIRRMLTLAVVFVGWMFFYFGNLHQVLEFLPKLVGIYDASSVMASYHLYLTPKLVLLTVVSLLCALFYKQEWTEAGRNFLKRQPIAYAVYQLGILVLAVISLMFLVNQLYQPFLYFQY